MNHPDEVCVLVRLEVEILEEGASSSANGQRGDCPVSRSAPQPEGLNDVAVGVEDGAAAGGPTVGKLSDEFKAALSQVERPVSI